MYIFIVFDDKEWRRRIFSTSSKLRHSSLGSTLIRRWANANISSSAVAKETAIISKSWKNASESVAEVRFPSQINRKLFFYSYFTLLLFCLVQRAEAFLHSTGAVDAFSDDINRKRNKCGPNLSCTVQCKVP